jgi:spoIIIJ-associated protein
MSEPDTEGQEVEATGETVGEAKWTALRELEKRFPGLDRDAVEFAVVSEGERGLLGVGQVPARVVARLAESLPPAPIRPPPVPAADESAAASQLRELLDRICDTLGTPAAISIHEDEDAISASLDGPGLGLLIGKHGQTIDAIQYLANAVLGRSEEERKPVVVDAAGYRSRRQAALERAADRAAERALAGDEAVALEPMSAIERNFVHLFLKEREGVETSSDGAEPNRCVVVRPAERA